MDALIRMHAEAGGLLGRVDLSLTRHGAPEGHQIWPLLRSRGLLPGDAVANVAAWGPEPLRERAELLQEHRERCSEIEYLLRVRTDWEGMAGAAFAARLDATRASQDLLASSACFIADYLEDLAAWVARGRLSLAYRLGAVLSSAEAVTLTVGEELPTVHAEAAAEIGAEVLAEADAFWTGALDISRDWSSRLELVAEIAMPGGVAGLGTTVGVELS